LRVAAEATTPNHQTIKPSNHQTIKPSNHQTIKPSNRTTYKNLATSATKKPAALPLAFLNYH
jgi:hypothetical protein